MSKWTHISEYGGQNHASMTAGGLEVGDSFLTACGHNLTGGTPLTHHPFGLAAVNCGHCLFAIAQEHTARNAGTASAPIEEPTMSPEKWQAKIQADLNALFVEKQIVPLFAVADAVREAFNPDNPGTPILASDAEIEAVVKAVTDRLKQQIGGSPL